MRRNHYLERKARHHEDMKMRRDYGHEGYRRMHSDYNYEREPMSDYRGYPERDYYDYDRERNYDFSDGMEKDYEEDLKKWVSKLKKQDRFGMPYDQLVKRAEEMGVKFDDFDEMEFYATYLMLISDFTSLTNDPNVYIKMAKDFLDDKDIDMSGSEKLCTYLYEIVLGGEDEEDYRRRRR